MKYFLLITMIFAAGCTKTPDPITQVGCSVETAVESAFASTIAKWGNCSHADVIQAAMPPLLGKANLCAQSVPAAPAMKVMSVQPKGVVGGIVCPLAVSALMGVAQSKIPPEWGCDPSAQVATLSVQLTTACIGAVPL